MVWLLLYKGASVGLHVNKQHTKQYVVKRVQVTLKINKGGDPNEENAKGKGLDLQGNMCYQDP